MKVLVVGGSGLLGMKVHEILEKKNYDVYATFYKNQIKKENSFPLDIVNKDDVNHVLKKISPDVIVHTAAYTDVDRCEKDRDNAFAVNVQGTRNLANIAEKLDAKFVYVSTDYIFGGEKGRYTENEDPGPCNYYGETKLQGEEAVKEICSDFVIARPSVIYGSNKINFVSWAMDHLEKGEKINVVNDQYISPTFNVDLARQIAALIEEDVIGIFHTAGMERIDRYNFVKAIADMFGLDKDLIYPVRMEDMNWIAQRPVDSSLDTFKISKFKKPYSIKESINLFREEMETSV